MNKMTRMTNDLRLRYHWQRIGKLRLEARKLIDKGTPCTDPALVALSNRVLQHGMEVSRIRNSQKPHYPRHLEPADREEESPKAITA